MIGLYEPERETMWAAGYNVNQINSRGIATNEDRTLTEAR